MMLTKAVQYMGRTISRIVWAGCDVDEETLTWVYPGQSVNWDTFRPGLAFVPVEYAGVELSPQFRLSDNPRDRFASAVRDLVPQADPHFDYRDGNWIGAGVEIPSLVKLGVGNVIYPGVSISAGTEIGSGCVIGGPGFNFERVAFLAPERLPHVGGVVIRARCRIHNGVNIDAGLLEPTLIGANTIIDSLVHVGHDCHIGAGCTLTAGAILAGWVSLGRGVWLAPNTTVKNRIRMGESSRTGMQTNVVHDVEDGQIVIGNPARPYMREQTAMEILAEANGV